MKFKVTKVYIVEAQTKVEAVEKITKNPDTLEYVTVKPVDESSGWGEQIKKQFGL